MLGSLLREIRNLDTSQKALRSFGLVIGGVLTLLAIWIAWRSGSLERSTNIGVRPEVVLGLIGLGLLVVAIVRPRPLLPLYYVWMGLALVLGVVMTRVILTVVFTVLIIPTGIVMRWIGRDPLASDGADLVDSYWISRKDMDRTPERLEKYF